MKNEYRHNHYVPEWYQKRFLPKGSKQQKFYYLDLSPETLVAGNGKRYQRNSMMRWGAISCFAQNDLYTTKFGDFEATEIEEKFFGDIDSKGNAAVEYFSDFSHPSADRQAFMDLMVYMSTQKLRTHRTAPAALGGFWAGHAGVSSWLAYMHLLLMLCPNTKFLTPPDVTRLNSGGAGGCTSAPISRHSTQPANHYHLAQASHPSGLHSSRNRRRGRTTRCTLLSTGVLRAPHLTSG